MATSDRGHRQLARAQQQLTAPDHDIHRLLSRHPVVQPDVSLGPLEWISRAEYLAVRARPAPATPTSSRPSPGTGTVTTADDLGQFHPREVKIHRVKLARQPLLLAPADKCDVERGHQRNHDLGTDNCSEKCPTRQATWVNSVGGLKCRNGGCQYGHLRHHGTEEPNHQLDDWIFGRTTSATVGRAGRVFRQCDDLPSAVYARAVDGLLGAETDLVRGRHACTRAALAIGRRLQ